MKEMLQDAWSRCPGALLKILLLNLASSLTGGISIVMLIPMLGLLEISADSVSALRLLIVPLQRLPYGGQLGVMIGLYLCLVALKAFLSAWLSLRETRFLEDYAFDLRDSLYQAVSHADWQKLCTGRQSDTVNLFTSQCSQVSSGVAQSIHLMAACVNAAVQLAIALWLSLPVTAFVFVCGGIFVFSFRRLFRASREYGEAMIRIDQRMYSELFSQLRSIRETRTYHVRREQACLFRTVSDDSRQAKMKYARLRALPQALYSCAAAVMIGIIFLVSVLVFRMDTARLMVLVYVFMRLWPVFSGLSGRVQNILSCVPAYEKLRDALENLQNGAETDDDALPMPFAREITFRQVDFAYLGGDEPVLRNVSFTLKKGTITALVGRSGAGKSTIADLLLGLLLPTGGEILVDGVPLTRDNLSSWRHAIGYIPQDPIILNTSVRENLMRFHPSATEQEMVDALRRARVWDVVEALPCGLDTSLGDEGVRLSGGERQRIVLARVLLGKPRFIIMDEATSALDYENELAIRKAVEELDENVTVLVIAHRLATVRTAQYALVLENGTITESGLLRELARRPESYLYRLLTME